MANVPIYKRKVSPQVVPTADKRIADPLKSASPGDAIRAGGELGKAVGDVGGALAKHILARQKEELDKQVLDADTQFRQEVDLVLNSTEVDDKNNPMGLLNQMGDNAKGSTISFDESFNSLKTEFADRFKGNAYQQENITSMMDKYYGQASKRVMAHEGNQTRIAYANTLNANLKQHISDGTLLRDPKDINTALAEIRDIGKVGFKAIGESKEVIADKLQMMEHQVIEGVIKSTITESDDALEAERILSDLKGKISDKTYDDMNKMVRGKKVENQSLVMYYSTKDMTLSDGSPDYDRIEQEIMGQKGYTSAELLKMENFVKSKAREQESDTRHRKLSNTNSFANELALAVKRGPDGSRAMTIQEAKKLTTKWGETPSEIATFELAVDRAYSVDVKTDATVHDELWSGIDRGITTKEDIDIAFANKLLSNKDYKSIIGHYYAPDKITSEVKFTLEKIKGELNTKFGNFGSSKEKKATINLLLKGHAVDGMSSQELQVKAKEYMEGEVRVPGYFGITHGVDLYEYEAEKQGEEALALGNIYKQNGRQESNGIVKGFNRTTRKSNPIKYNDPKELQEALFDFEYKLTQLGVEKFVPVDDTLGESTVGGKMLDYGTPVHNAIMVLQSNNILVTPENVIKIMEQLNDKDKTKGAI